MALKALLLRKQIDNKKKELDELRGKAADFEKRENDLAKAIDEVTSDEERQTVEDEITAFDTEKAQHGEAVAALERTIAGLEDELKAEEAKQITDPPEPEPTKHEEERSITMHTTNRALARMNAMERAAFIGRDDVKTYLAEVRAAMREKRALTNVGLTIPEVMLGLIRENIENYSKLYKHVNVRRISGDGTIVIMGSIPEAIWTDCCAALNELGLGFNNWEFGCYKVAGYFAVCNATLEDSDLDLAGELLTAIGQAIGLALDKAILYGRNANTTQKMPQGVMSRLVETEAPSGYPATARPWADLHTSNVTSIAAASSTGIKLFQAIVNASGKAKNKYSRGELVWIMNETTHTTIMSEAMSINAAGSIVAGIANTMPVVGGVIEKLNFLPDNVIIFGYFDNYILVERAGQKFATSDHVRFLQDETVFKGTARYDGAPVIPEAFGAIGIAGTTPNATMTFPADTANS